MENITEEIVKDAVARFLAQGGKIQRDDDAPEVNSEWAYDNVMAKLEGDSDNDAPF